VVDRGGETVTPPSRARRFEDEIVAGAAAAERDRRGIGIVVGDADDERQRAPVKVEVAYRVAHRAVDGEAAEAALVIGELGQHLRRVRRPRRRTADERRDRRRYADDGADTARNLVDVDSRVADRDCHFALPRRRRDNGSPPASTTVSVAR
jgi:hypothetical protein